MTSRTRHDDLVESSERQIRRILSRKRLAPRETVWQVVAPIWFGLPDPNVAARRLPITGRKNSDLHRVLAFIRRNLKRMAVSECHAGVLRNRSPFQVACARVADESESVPSKLTADRG